MITDKSAFPPGVRKVIQDFNLAVIMLFIVLRKQNMQYIIYYITCNDRHGDASRDAIFEIKMYL